MHHLETCLLIARADRVLCLLMFFTVFSDWMCKMRNEPLVEVFGNPISDGIVSKMSLFYSSLLDA